MLIHITGASGCGSSTLAEALATRLGATHLDTDDFFWLPSDPPFRHRRPADERRSSLLGALRSGGGDAVVSGAVSAWGDEIENAFDLIVFLYVETEIRLARLRERELRRFGRVDPDFMTWAAQYDEGPPEGRSLANQKAWLGARTCPVLTLEGNLSTQERLERIHVWMAANPTQGGAV